MNGETADRVMAIKAAGQAHARLDWLDALKGVGIILVVAGHVWTRGAARDAIYLFHMPLFFLASGYMLAAAPLRVLTPRLAQGLLIPFLAFATLLIGADFLIEGLRGVRPIYSGWGEAYRTILLETAATRGPFTILWFIPCLVLARLIWTMLALCWPAPEDWRWATLAVALLALAAMMRWTASPFAIQAVPGALVLLWLGTLWRRHDGAGSGGLAGLALGAGALAALVLLPPVNMKIGALGLPFLSLAGAVIVTLALAYGLRRLPAGLLRPLVALGRMSLVIMYTHVAFIHYLAPYGSRPLLFAVALAGGVAIDLVVRRFALTRRLLLGERR